MAGWPFYLGFVTFALGSVGVAVVAFKDSVSQGLLCLFIPFYVIVYTRKAQDQEAVRLPYRITLVGIAVSILGLILLAMFAWSA